MKYRVSILGLLLLLLLVGCARSSRLADLPTPERTCNSTAVVGWNSLVPRESTKEDVIRVLGRPPISDTQTFKSPPGWESLYYAYPVQSGDIAEGQFSHYKIYFRPDDTIDWMEIPIGDVDGKYHAVQEYTHALGNTVDALYPNRSGDVLGPDEVVVWSECGLALVLLYTCQAGIEDYSVACHPASNGPEVASSTEYTTTLQVRSREGDQLIAESHALSSAVLLKIVFPPTTYNAYQQYFAPVVPNARHYFLGVK